MIKGLDKWLTTPPEDDQTFETFNIDIFADDAMDLVFDPTTTPDDVYAEIEKEVEKYMERHAGADKDYSWNFMQRYYHKQRSKKPFTNFPEALLAIRKYEQHLAAIRKQLTENKDNIIKRSQK